MQSKKLTLMLAAAGLAAGQREGNTTICDYYTKALLTNNTAANQYTLLTLLVNTVVIGNYTQPNVGVSVPGILAAGTYDGVAVNLAPYFTGALASTNRGGTNGTSVNFLDGGGAAPLMENKPANSTQSNQFSLLTHLYSYFGSLLQCSQYSMDGFPAYNGSGSMYEVHKFMALSPAEVGYFITQVGLAAQSFGVALADVNTVAVALNTLFGTRCSPELAVIPSQTPALQAICIQADCPISLEPACDLYGAVVEPKNADGTTPEAPATSMTNVTTTPTISSTPAVNTAQATTTMPPSLVPTAGAATAGLSLMAALGGLAAVLL